MSETVYIGIGGNIGDASQQVATAVESLKAIPASRVLETASLYGSKAYGPVEQEDFVNTVAALETDLAPRQLLDALKAIETRLGREQTVRWGPRVIDLDILTFGDRQLEDEDLVVPHPDIRQRAFVLFPLAEIAPDLQIDADCTARQARDQLSSGLVWPLVE